MMNTTINGNINYKDFLIMDCYSGTDAGGAVAFGVGRQVLGAYIMRSEKDRASWAQSAELIGTHNYTSYTVKKDGTGASGTWGISITGNAATATKLNNSVSLWGQSFDGSNNVSGNLTGSYFGIVDRSSNPYLRLYYNSTNWYVQGERNGLMLGNGVDNSVLITDVGNIVLPDTSTRISLNYTNRNYCIYYNAGQGNRICIGASAAVGLNALSLLLSDAWSDYTNVPSCGIYSKGNILSAAGITAKSSSSDIRLKTDIEEYDALSIVTSHRSVKYHWNEVAKRNSAVFNDDEWHFGLIAQELQREYPQLVKDVFGDYLTIDYERLIPVMWRAIQQLAKRNEELQKQMNEERRIA